MTASALWKSSGRPEGSLVEGAVIALKGEAGYQADIFRGGLHWRPLAVAICRPQVSPDYDQARQDRLYIQPRRRPVDAFADLGQDR